MDVDTVGELRNMTAEDSSVALGEGLPKEAIETKSDGAT